jgi:NAD(P)H-dependent FMN reductase
MFPIFELLIEEFMKTIITLPGSNSSTSINKQLLNYAASQLDDVNTIALDLNDFEMPIYSTDREAANGHPEKAKELISLFKQADGLMLSLAEYNGAYSGAFKNIFDWLSRVEQKTFLGKPMLLMAASPGGRGGASVLAIAQDRFPFHDAKITGVFSFPFFNDNFDNGMISNTELRTQLHSELEKFKAAL